MQEPRSQIDVEISEAPNVIWRQEAFLKPELVPLVKRLKQQPPQLVVTCARGSSAHAAVFATVTVLKYSAT